MIAAPLESLVKTGFVPSIVMSAFLLMAAPAVAQQGQNIAGTYRGLMTGCLSRARGADCRKGFIELIRIADEVDAKRAEWERVTAAGNGAAAKMKDAYTEALERLNRAVVDFNRDMNSPAPETKSR